MKSIWPAAIIAACAAGCARGEDPSNNALRKDRDSLKSRLAQAGRETDALRDERDELDRRLAELQLEHASQRQDLDHKTVVLGLIERRADRLADHRHHLSRALGQVARENAALLREREWLRGQFRTKSAELADERAKNGALGKKQEKAYGEMVEILRMLGRAEKAITGSMRKLREPVEKPEGEKKAASLFRVSQN